MTKKETGIALTQKVIESKIFTIRDAQVILDKDLASFYEVKPIRLREQVKRNANRFPDDFVFRLSEDEVEMLVSQNAIPYLKAFFNKIEKHSLVIFKMLGFDYAQPTNVNKI